MSLAGPGQVYDFKIGDEAFKQKNLNPMVALGVVSKFGAVLKHLPAIMRAVEEFRGKLVGRPSVKDIADALLKSDVSFVGPIGQVISDLPDAYRDYIIEQALRVTFRQSGPGFMPMWDAAAGEPVAGVDAVLILKILAQTARLQILPFLPDPASLSSDLAGAQASTASA